MQAAYLRVFGREGIITNTMTATAYTNTHTKWGATSEALALLTRDQLRDLADELGVPQAKRKLDTAWRIASFLDENKQALEITIAVA